MMQWCYWFLDWHKAPGWFSSVQFSHSVVSESATPWMPPCPSPTPGVYSNSYPLSWWCHPTISSSVVPFSSCIQSLPASQSFPGWLVWSLSQLQRGYRIRKLYDVHSIGLFPLKVHRRLCPSHLQCGPWTSSISITWEIIRNANPRPSPQTTESESAFKPETRWFLYTLKFGFKCSNSSCAL